MRPHTQVKEGQTVWDAYAYPPAPKVTAEEVLVFMRRELETKRRQRAALDTEIRVLEMSIAYVEDRGLDLPPLPPPVERSGVGSAR
jgi:hypothetical protein